MNFDDAAAFATGNNNADFGGMCLNSLSEMRIALQAVTLFIFWVTPQNKV